MSMTITVDASAAAFANGVNLRVEVLTNAAVTQNGAAANSHTAESAAITTTAIGSRVYGSALNNNTSFTVNGSTTAIDNIADTTNSVRYGTCKQKTDTVSTGSETIGYSTSLTDGGIALYEVLPVSGQTLIEDGSAPVVVTNKTGKTATSAGFTPPQGSTIVVLASALTNGAFTISDTWGLTWVKQSTVNTDGTATVWTAYVPGPSSGDPYIAALGAWNAVSSVALPVIHDVAAGDVLIVETSSSSGTGSSVTDSQSNAYSFDQTDTNSQNDANFTCPVSTPLTVAGSDTITPVRSSASGSGNVIVIGIPNAAASSPVEGSSVSKVAHGTSAAPSVTSGTLSQADEILIAAESNTMAGGAPVWASPFATNVLSNQMAPGGIRLSVAWARVSATTAVTAAGAIVSSAWATMLTAIKLAPSGDAGTGSVKLKKMGLSGSGTETDSGTGSVKLKKMALAGTAKETEFGTGSVKLKKMGVAASGSEKWVATGSVKLKKMAIAGSGTETEIGSGSVKLKKMVLAGSGTETEIGTGSVKLKKMGVAGSGKPKWVATGGVHIHKMVLAGSGTETEIGSGSVKLKKMVLLGHDTALDTGTGSIGLKKPALGGAGNPNTIRLFNNAETGTDGTSVTTSNSGGPGNSKWDAVQIPTSGSLTYNAANAARGGLAYKIVTGSPVTNGIVEWTTSLGDAVERISFRAEVKLPSLPGATLVLITARNGSTSHALLGITSAGKIQLRDAANVTQATGTVAVTANQYFRIEGYFICDASNGYIEAQLFTGIDDTVPAEVVKTAANLNTTGPVNRWDIGNQSSIASYTIYLDDIAVSTGGYIGPVPQGTAGLKKMGVAASGSVVGPDLWNNFSGLSNGATVSTSNAGGVSGRSFDAVNIIAGSTLAADNTHLGLDAMALKVATTTTTGTPFAQWSKAGSLGYDRTKMYFRCDNLITAAASPAFRPIALRTTGGTHIFSVLISGNAVSCSYGSAFNGLTAFSNSVTNGQYFRVEGFIDITAGTVHIELYLKQTDAVPVATKDFTGVAFGNNIQRIDVGNANSSTGGGPFWIDQVGFSDKGPLSPPHVFLHKMSLSGSGQETDTGTGSVKLKKMALAGVAHAPDLGTGSVRLKKMGVAASGRASDISSGSVRLHKMVLAASGVHELEGTGSVALHKMVLAASAVETEFGSGSVDMHKMSVDGSGQETDTGTGSVSMHKMGLSGTASAPDVATGSVSMHKMGVAGVGIVTGSDSAVGSVQLHKMILSGSGQETDKGTGSVHIHKMSLAGEGDAVGSFGHVSLHKMGLSGAGRESTSGVAHISLHKMHVQGQGKDTSIGSVRLKKMHVEATNIFGQASPLFIFTSV